MKTVVLYPTPTIGHLISMVEMAKLIITQNPSLSVTILIPTIPFINPSSSFSSYISSATSSFPSISFHYLPSISLLLGDPSNYTHFIDIFFENAHNNSSNVHHFIQSISVSTYVEAFILDLFCYPTLEVAQSFNIPTYFYYTGGAGALCFAINFSIFHKIAPNGFRNFGSSKLVEIPGLCSVPASCIMDELQDAGVTFDECAKMSSYLTKSDGLIANTFESLEPRAVKSIMDSICLGGTPLPPIYCIGPLIATLGDNDKQKECKRHECLSWLDTQPKGSVVFLSFGSFGAFSEKQIREIAIGLERSGVGFLWVVRDPPGEDKGSKFKPQSDPDLDLILPNGFLDRTQGRGLVVKSWAPQIAVLTHDSVGGFMTHCGWNSIIEAICAGVPMIAWPLYAEQKVNKHMLVEVIKIALPLNMLEDRFVSSDEIERRVKQIISSKEGDGDAIRKRVLELRDEAKATHSEGGLSRVNLARLVKSWEK